MSAAMLPGIGLQLLRDDPATGRGRTATEDTLSVSFFVPGVPKAKGTLVRGTRNDGTHYQRPDNRYGEGEWSASVKFAAHKAMAGRQPTEGPVHLELTFFRPRPKGHFNTKGVLKAQCAALLPKSAPDWDKVGRSVGDALQGALYLNDAQVTTCLVRKRWGNPGVNVVARDDRAREEMA